MGSRLPSRPVLNRVLSHQSAVHQAAPALRPFQKGTVSPRSQEVKWAKAIRALLAQLEGRAASGSRRLATPLAPVLPATLHLQRQGLLELKPLCKIQGASNYSPRSGVTVVRKMIYRGSKKLASVLGLLFVICWANLRGSCPRLMIKRLKWARRVIQVRLSQKVFGTLLSKEVSPRLRPIPRHLSRLLPRSLNLKRLLHRQCRISSAQALMRPRHPNLSPLLQDGLLVVCHLRLQKKHQCLHT